MTFDAEQAAKVKRANRARFEPCIYPQMDEPPPKPPAGNRVVSIIVGILGALCALGAVLAAWHARGVL